MTNTQHTPGPWSTNMAEDWFWSGCDKGDWHEGQVFVNYGSGKGSSICSFTVNEINEDGSYHREGYWSDDEQRANAHLIAAAPELYEALEWIAGKAEWAQQRNASGYLVDMAEKARAALAKARGESQA